MTAMNTLLLPSLAWRLALTNFSCALWVPAGSVAGCDEEQQIIKPIRRVRKLILTDQIKTQMPALQTMLKEAGESL